MKTPFNPRGRFVSFLLALVFVTNPVQADWPMPGHDPQRTSWAPEDEMAVPATPKWYKKFDSYLPASVQIITSAKQNKVYVTAADGIYALEPLSGTQLWKYPLALPPGDAPTYVNNVLYISGTDKSIHAVDAATGVKKWQTDEAGMGFYVNPLVINNRVYAGNLDGYFYCFDAATGSYLWSYRVGEPIRQSAAFQTYQEYPNGVIFFAAKDLRAHAIKADTGEAIWRSNVLTGAERFDGYWPVVFDEVVFFVAGTMLPSLDNSSITNLQRDGMKKNYADIPVAPNGWYDFQHHRAWQTQHPYIRTTFVLDRNSGLETQKSPFMHSGPQEGYRSPPVVGPNPAGTGPARLVWARTPWEGTSFFGFGRFMGWQVGTGLARLVPGLEGELESSDEGESYTIIGSNYIYSSLASFGEAGHQGGVFRLAGGQVIDLDASSLGGFDSQKSDHKYNIGMNNGNAPVPLNGRIYLHKRGAVLCFGH